MMLRYSIFFVAVVYISLEQTQAVIIEGPVTTIVLPPVDVVQFNCTHTEGVSSWEVNGTLHSQNNLADGELVGHSITTITATNGTGNAILVLDVVLGDSRNGNAYVCVIPQTFPLPDIQSDPAFLRVAGLPEMVPSLTIVPDSVIVDGDDVNFMVYWGEPFNNFDPIISYTIQCDGTSGCDAPIVTDDNTTRSHNFTDLPALANYTLSVFATNSIGDGISATIMVNGVSAFGVPNEITGLNLTCQPIGTNNSCTSYWNPPTQGNDDLAMLQYTVYVNGDFYMNVTQTTITFSAPALPEEMFLGNVSITVTPVNRFGEGPTSDNVTAEIMSSSVTDIRVTVTTLRPSDFYSATVNCTIHSQSNADKCQVLAIPTSDAYTPITVSGTINNLMASVVISSLKCEVSYMITAGGTQGGDLVGPNFLYGPLTTDSCPEEITTTSVTPTSTSTMIATPTPTVRVGTGSAAGLKCSMMFMVAFLIAVMTM